jgi:hypothetical protein
VNELPDTSCSLYRRSYEMAVLRLNDRILQLLTTAQRRVDGFSGYDTLVKTSLAYNSACIISDLENHDCEE